MTTRNIDQRRDFILVNAMGRVINRAKLRDAASALIQFQPGLDEELFVKVASPEDYQEKT